MLKYIEFALWVFTALFLGYAFWNGWRIEVGKPGEKSHVLIEFYSIKRNFK